MVKYHKILTTHLQQKSTCSFLFVLTKKKIDSIKSEHYFYHKQLLISIKKKSDTSVTDFYLFVLG